MKKLLILALLVLPAAAHAQGADKSEFEGIPCVKEAGEALEPVQRPDSRKIMSELSTALRLSSKQEERISAAVSKKTTAFDKIMREFDKNSVEEKKWRYKMNANRYEMMKLNRELPDAIREFLDDEQRENYDELLETAKKPAGAAVEQAPAGEEGASSPVKKKRLIKRKKMPAGAAPLLGEDESGQVMVDKEAAAAQPGARKKRVLKKKPAPRGEPGAEEEPAYERAGSKPTGKEVVPEEEDLGSYP